MNFIPLSEDCEHYDPFDPRTGQEQIYVQFVISLALGLSAFFSFCYLRPRWKNFYAAGKHQLRNANALPELPDSFLGWIPVLHRVNEDQVLQTAGLDAYVFLVFFKMSIKLFSTILIISIVVLAPINNHFDWLPTFGYSKNPYGSPSTSICLKDCGNQPESIDFLKSTTANNGSKDAPDPTYLWAYLIFTYIFTGLSFYFMTSQTKSIIKVRQNYLSSQSNIANRTFKLSEIPPKLRSERNIKDYVEKLDIGKVKSVSMVRNWEILDKLMDQRASISTKLEAALNMYFRKIKSKEPHSTENLTTRMQETNQISQAEERDSLLGQGQNTIEFDESRPKKRIFFGPFGGRSKKIDMIDFYEEKLRSLDEKITVIRKREYPLIPMAFVTMDSISACQIAVQVLLDPLPMQLLTDLAPAPTQIVWKNTYLPRYSRIIRAWLITIFITFLTIFWVVPVAVLAGLLDTCSIQRILPIFAKFMANHKILKSLIQSLQPILVSLLNISVPFLYDFLSNQQGMISQGDVELSLISKNFFFTFFNVFLTFTIAGTATKFWSTLQDSLKDTTFLALKLAGSVQQIALFYINFILLQGIGVIPLVLLEFGRILFHPVLLMRCKRLGDYSEFSQPPIFKYGFYLPPAILVYILCIVYSILPAGYLVLFFGVIYFINSYYTYKYQLLYAMDHPQHTTGAVWPMICYRILLGLVVFQVVMAGIIALKNQFYAAGLVVPLIFFTIWYSYQFSRNYHPLMNFVSLGSIKKKVNTELNTALINNETNPPTNNSLESYESLGEERDEMSHYLNPNLSSPLTKPWIKKSPKLVSDSNQIEQDELFVPNIVRESSSLTTISLGDTHIWRESNNN